MVGIYVNDKEAPFTDWILDGVKKMETRNRKTLNTVWDWNYFKDVALIRTGKGKSTIVGTIKPAGVLLWYEHWKNIEGVNRELKLLKGTRFEGFKDSKKWFYMIYDPHRCKPVPIPDGAVRHGRVWVELGDIKLEEV